MNVTEDDIKTYIDNELGIQIKECTKVSSNDAPVKAFKVTVKALDAGKMMDQTVWPENIRVRKFYSKPRRNDRARN